MRFLTLTDAVAAKLLADRRSGDAAADRVAARIIADVRKRGDAALFSWSRKLDRVRLTPKTMWITRRDIDSAAREVLARAARCAGARRAQYPPRGRAAAPAPVEHEGRARRARVAARDAARDHRLLRSRRAILAGFDAADVGGARASRGREAHRGRLPAPERRAAGRRATAGRLRNRAHRRRAGHRRAGLRHALGSARGQDFRPRQSLRHRRQAPGQRRLRRGHARRARPKCSSWRSAAMRATSRPTWWRRPSTIPTPSRCW